MRRTPLPLDADAFRHALVGSFEEDAAPRGAKLAAMAALGVAVAPTAALGSAASAPATTIAGVSGSVPKVGAIVVLKWMGLGIIGGAAVVAPAKFLDDRRGAEDRPPIAASPSERASTPPRAPEPLAVAEPNDRTPSPVDPPAPREKSPPTGAIGPGAARAVAAPSPSDISGAVPPAIAPEVPSAQAPSQPTTLAIEIARLDAARRALSEGHVTVALSILDAYAREFPNGALFPEAVVLQVEAMIRTGNRAGAAALADRVAGTLPDRYARRIRELVLQKAADR